MQVSRWSDDSIRVEYALSKKQKDVDSGGCGDHTFRTSRPIQHAPIYWPNLFLTGTL